MRGFFLRRRRVKWASAAALWAAFFYAVSFQQGAWMKALAEDKLEGFLGGKYAVRIEKAGGGILRDMVLENVSLEERSGGRKGQGFRIERVDIAYCLWRPAAKKLGLVREEDAGVGSVALYFSRTNPFVRGFIRLDRREGGMAFLGGITPVFLGAKNKVEIKGEFSKCADGKYDCEMLLGGAAKVSGVIDPGALEADLCITPAAASSGTLKVKVSVSGEKTLKAYCRSDKLVYSGREIIGDAWIEYANTEDPVFSLRVENVVADKRPYWDLSVKGAYRRKEKTLALEEVKAGKSVSMSGEVGTADPYGSDLRIDIRGLEIAVLAGMMGESKLGMQGTVDGEISLEGPLMAPVIKARLRAGEGFIGNLSFKSLYATLAGKFPVVKVIDSRLVKEGGIITVSGEADFSRPGENKFENIKFGDEGGLAFFDQWQIGGTGEREVAASKENVTLRANLQDGGSGGQAPNAGPPEGKSDFGVKYKVDSFNSVKLEVDEDKDFVGVEHKVQF